MAVKLILAGLLLFLCSCADKRLLKQISYNDKSIFLKVHDGGATTSFYWDISIVSNGLLSQNEDIIFKSYGSPIIEDIKVNGDTLKIVCYGLGTDNFQTIDINLNKVDIFIDHPVKYTNSQLEQTNDAYQEPMFLTDLHEFEKAHGMY